MKLCSACLFILIKKFEKKNKTIIIVYFEFCPFYSTINTSCKTAQHQIIFFESPTLLHAQEVDTVTSTDPVQKIRLQNDSFKYRQN